MLFDAALYKSGCVFRKFFNEKKIDRHYVELKKWHYTYNLLMGAWNIAILLFLKMLVNTDQYRF